MVRGCCRLWPSTRGFLNRLLLDGERRSAVPSWRMHFLGDPTAVAPLSRASVALEVLFPAPSKVGGSTMSTRMPPPRANAGGTLSMVRSLDGTGVIVGLAGISILCLAQASRGREQDEKTIRAKVVVAERFLLDSLGRDTRVNFGLRPAPARHLRFSVGKDPARSNSVCSTEPRRCRLSERLEKPGEG